ncbi:MAG: aldehyde ferredoxin oxidoreductase family protein [Dehalococcoidia bacterium]|nr:aldehyde ferredoxin oxidoreductase family protein [Dehalococcoidia bacterium]
MGKIARVNLGTGQVTVQELPRELATNYLGGRGFGVRFLYDEVGPSVEPLSPGNSLIFASGPLTGTKAPTGGRFSVSTRSPLTGTVVDSNSGGKWGVRFKGTGYDALIITGKAARPVWLFIDEAGVTVNDASKLWGLDVEATTDSLLGQVAKPAMASVACIGPAGENMVRFASIINDRSRAVGRGGVGAVMGSKNLKAIVASGNRKPAVADAEGLEFIVYESQKALKQSPITAIGLPRYGTAGIVHIMNKMGAFPTRNFTDCTFEHADEVSGEALRKRLFVKQTACWGCPIGCTRVTKTKHSKGEGPEYESLWALGPECGIHDLEVIAEANYLCNRLGLDTISTGVTIGCLMELVNRGIVKEGVHFGDAGALLALIEDIAHRRGLGDAMAEGSRRFAEKYGAPECAMQVKGLELPAYEPRAMGAQGLAFATSNRGGCHLRGNMLNPEILGVPKLVDRFGSQDNVGLLIYHQHLAAAFDALGVCKFAGYANSDEHLARMLSAVTGIQFASQDLHLIGERIWNLERLYNLREGFTCKDDTLPRRLLEEPLKQGPAKGRVVNLAPMLAEYYRFRSWNAEGVPTKEKLKQLGLEA